MKQGNKIILRNWQQQDLERYKYWHIGKHSWMDYDGPYYEKPTIEETNDRIKQLAKNITENNWPTPYKRLVIANKSDNVLIGTVSWYWQSEETNWKSIGIVIYDEEYWSKGIGYEALKHWIDYLFETCTNIVRLDLRTWSGNERMMRLAEKLGFTLEARFRMARIVAGTYYDSIGMGLLRKEWETNHTTY